MSITLAAFLAIQSIVTSLLLLFPGNGAPVQVSGLDANDLATWITLAGILAAALIGGAFLLFQTLKTVRVQKQLQDEQLKFQKQLQDEQLLRQQQFQDEQLLLRKQLQDEQFQHNKELEKLRQILEKQAQDEQSEQQRRAAAQTAMRHAKTVEEQVKAYRQALCADPLLAHLQVLDMTQPLAVTDIYVRLRVYQNTRSVFHIDADAQEAEQRHDPNVLLQLGRERLEQRAATALAPEAAIRTYKRSVVVGDPGAGKSTLLKHLALLAAEQKLPDLPNLPLHIELSAFALSKQQHLLEFAATVWEERYGFPQVDALAYLQSICQQGQALILCDALDETATGSNREEAEASYGRVSQSITTFATRYPLVPIVVTARKAGYHQRALLSGFTEVEVLDFRQEDIIQFVQSWFALHQEGQKQGNASDLIAKLQRNPRIQALATNPLFLTLITLVYEDQLDLPDRRAELYKQCVDTLLTKWDASRNIRRRRAFKVEQKRRLLEEVAWHFHLQGRRYFPEPELLDHIAAFLPALGLAPEENGQILAEIAAENGLLKEQARGWNGFLHLTVQEFFVAQAATSQQQFEALFVRRNNPWWEEVLLLYAGLLPNASRLLERLLDQSEAPSEARPTELFHTDLLLAGRCLAASAVVRQVALRENIITRLFTLLQNSPYSLIHQHAAETLIEIGGATVQNRLLALLSNQQIDLNVRMSIAKALGDLGERAMAPQLITLLSNERIDLNVRMSIAETLGDLGERAMASQLVDLLLNQHLDPHVRMRIAKALGNLGEHAVASQLLALLSNQEMNVSVRESIAEALGALGARAVVPQLLALLSNAQMNVFVRMSIALALGALGERSVAPRLVDLLSDAQVDTHVRMSIALALGTLGEYAVIPQLLVLLSNAQVNKDVRMNIAEALGALGERSVAPQLVDLLSDAQVNVSVRERIALALGALGERSVVPQLLALLSNQQVDLHVRMNIALALGALGELAVAPHLVALLSNQQVDLNVHWRIARALGALGERAVVSQLIDLLSNQQVDLNVRGRIATSLSSLVESKKHVSLLAELLWTSDFADAIYSTLWIISRRLGLRILVSNGTERQQVKIVKLSEGSYIS